jgi:DNA invertase Pin-like site-specific DNA recombinase
MSDIPRARAILRKADKVLAGDERMLRYIITQALQFLDREKPEFKAKRKLPPLTIDQAMQIKELRADGVPVNEIARRFGTNIGRVSEIINGLRDGI